MKISYFCNPTNLNQERPYLDVLEEVRDLAMFCERHDFHTIWFAEHHFSLWGREMLPNPVVMGTDIAARTERIRIGLAAAIITFWHPLRLAEDVALLDQLSGGRVELGLGRGNYGIEGLNLNPAADPNKPEENYQVFEDTLNILKLAFSQKRFAYQGSMYTFPTPGFKTDRAHTVELPDYIDADTGEMAKISVYPQPLQRPGPQMWQVVDGDRSIEFAAQNDLGIIMWRPPVSALKEKFERYRETAEAASGQSLDPGARCGIMRDLFVAPSEKEARALAEEAVMGTLNFSNWRGPSIYLEPGETLSEARRAALEAELDFDFVNDRSLLFGTPDQVAEKMQELEGELGVEQVLLNCHWPGLSHEATMRSMQLFVDEVVPQLGEAVT
ncbi:MAG: LLM class flavin-dependent oxidoreductase [Pseudomonadota bacterium]